MRILRIIVAFEHLTSESARLKNVIDSTSWKPWDTDTTKRTRWRPQPSTESRDIGLHLSCMLIVVCFCSYKISNAIFMMSRARTPIIFRKYRERSFQGLFPLPEGCVVVFD